VAVEKFLVYRQTLKYAELGVFMIEPICNNVKEAFQGGMFLNLRRIVPNLVLLVQDIDWLL